MTEKNKFSKRLTKELSMANFSHEEYYYHGEASVSVPFMWESEPGTPKVGHFRETTLPPLTPPPSYCYSTSSKSTNIRKPSKSYTLLQAIFPKLHASSKNSTTPLPSSPALSSSSSSASSSSSPRSTSYSVPSSPITPWKFRGRGKMASRRLSVDSRMVNDDQYEEHRSSLCLFGRGTNNKNNNRSRAAALHP
ncbi:hypothetical protein FEM48_Zijuj02G0113800 [Ziziphus jujuba var. spinosa]|uniref:Uncharacterized protein n=1 Tax=Ziziphus jujuba var. spinosa TaxID=714518 RepID=A0A978VVG0_ZIZJJ|nr:hypothetical protein FEM48_Zijuj02G0113800 [Ziziphus jujuba var. spinosa]